MVNWFYRICKGDKDLGPDLHLVILDHRNPLIT